VTPKESRRLTGGPVTGDEIIRRNAVEHPDGSVMFVTGARVVIAREVMDSWWRRPWVRLVDWIWPPLFRYGDRAVFRLTVNGIPFVTAPLRYAMRDRRTGTAIFEFGAPPLRLGMQDLFQATVEFNRKVPIAVGGKSMLDGFMMRDVS
jgi:hypothetical protein